MEIKLPINLDTTEEITIVRWLDTGVEAPGFYSFTRAAGGSEFALNLSAPESDGNIVILDGAVAAGAEAGDGSGEDTYLVTEDLNVSITIRDNDGDDNADIIQFGAGFVATSITVNKIPASPLLGIPEDIIVDFIINFEDSDGNAQTITIIPGKALRYRLGEDGDALSFDDFATQARIDGGFRINHKPVLSVDGTGEIDENTTAQTDTGITFTATDADSDDDDTVAVTVYESDGTTVSTLFEAVMVDPDDASQGYKLVTIAADPSPFDADGGTVSYNLVISAGDGEDHVTEEVTVSIANLNDNTPVVTVAGTGAINENITAETDTGITFSATDADGDAVAVTVYESDGTTVSTLFKAVMVDDNDASQGYKLVSIAADPSPFDADGGTTSYDLVISASDGTTSGTQSVTVSVTDLLDHGPVVTIPTALSVAEDVADATTVHTFVATGDLNNDGITYALATADADKGFALSAAGVLTVSDSSKFDYETATSVTVTVEATQSGLTTSEEVTIAITNVNDNAPVMTVAGTGSIAENTTAQTDTGITFSATDADNDALTVTVYESDGTTESTLFDAVMVDPADASQGYKLVTIAADPSPFDFEGGTTSYALVISASDGTTSVTDSVTVSVADALDQGPVFGAVPTDLSVDEDDAIGTIVHTFSATGDVDNTGITLPSLKQTQVLRLIMTVN